MNVVLKQLTRTLAAGKKFGENHTPEHQLLTRRTKYMNKNERKEFEEEYENLIKKGIILREKKRTGKNADWHISLNNHFKKEIEEIIRL